MNILFIGDIFGEDAIRYLEQNLDKIKRENNIHVVIANAENVTYGKGLAKKHYDRLCKLGISCFTMGNHTFSNSDIRNYIDDARIARPANLNTTLGKPYYTFKFNDKTITVINMLGRVYMNNTPLDCPFQTMDKLLKEIKSDIIIVDMHAEATSEKLALAFDFDSKVTAVVGTHTHVQTADERVLPKGTLYISDIGMTGPLNGIIGNSHDEIIDRFRTGVYSPAQVEKGPIQFNAVVLELGLKNKIKRIHIEE